MNDVFLKLCVVGWNGYWIDVVLLLWMKDDVVIIFDLVNFDVIKDVFVKGMKNFIGGNCMVSLMLMVFGGLFCENFVDWMMVMIY